jgi:DNA-binding PadR family transcriptional regulator
VKKDPELIRLMLLRTEAIGSDTEAAERYHADCLKYDEPTRAYHALLMKEDGLIEGLVTSDPVTGRPNRAAITRLTTKGHEYLDRVRIKGPPKGGEPSKWT